MKHYLLQLFIAADQLVCALFGGWADESLSSYFWRLEKAGKPAGRLFRPVVDRIFNPGHCKSAYDAERLRAQLPPELRG